MPAQEAGKGWNGTRTLYKMFRIAPMWSEHMVTITKARIPQTYTKVKGKINYSLGNKTQGRGEVTYRNVCQYCNTTRNLITVRRAGGDLFLCRKHARGLGVI